MPAYDEVQKKLNALRTYYVAEKNKTKKTKVSGAETADLYRSEWQFFESLSFLSDNVVPKATSSNAGKRRPPGSDDEGNKFAYSFGGGPSPKSAKQVVEANSRTNSLIESTINILERPRANSRPEQSPKSADKIFTEMLCSMLETILDGQSKDFLKMEFQRHVYETKYMVTQRSLPQNYQGNSMHQSTRPSFSNMLNQDPYEQNFIASSSPQAHTHPICSRRII